MRFLEELMLTPASLKLRVRKDQACCEAGSDCVCQFTVSILKESHLLQVLLLGLMRALLSPGRHATDVAMESWSCVPRSGESQRALEHSRCSADVTRTARGDAMIPAGTGCTLFLPKTKT